MGLPKEILRVMQKSPIYVERYDGRDDAGNAAYRPAEKVPSAITDLTKGRGGSTGRSETITKETEVTASILVDAIGLTPYDRVTMPDGKTKPHVVSVSTTNGPDGKPFFQIIEVNEHRR